MKKITVILFLLVCVNIHSQIIRPYAGFVVYVHSDFANSLFFNVKTGGEFKISKYLKPEIEFSLLGGAVEDFTVKNENIIIQEYTRSVTALNFSVCPKIIIGNESELNSYFVVLPKYSISHIEANGNLSNYNDTGHLTGNKHANSKIWSHSIGFGVGYNFNLSDDNPDSLCIILDCQGVELGDALNHLNEENKNRILTKWAFGLGVNYYFNFKKKKD